MGHKKQTIERNNKMAGIGPGRIGPSDRSDEFYIPLKPRKIYTEYEGPEPEEKEIRSFNKDNRVLEKGIDYT